MSAFALQWLVLALDASIKAALIALVTGALLQLSRAADSNIRHRVWMAVLVGMFFLPALSRVIPGLTLPLHLPLDRLLVVEESPEIAVAQQSSSVQPPEAAAPTFDPEQIAERMASNARPRSDRVDFMPNGAFPGVDRG